MRRWVLVALVVLGCERKPPPANPSKPQPDPPSGICTKPDYKHCPPK